MSDEPRTFAEIATANGPLVIEQHCDTVTLLAGGMPATLGLDQQDEVMGPLMAAWMAAEAWAAAAPGPLLDPDCRGGNHSGCVGPPGTPCDCPCHRRGVAGQRLMVVRGLRDEAW